MNGYNWLLQQLKELKLLGAKVYPIGKSVLGRNIYAVEIGEGEKVLIQYGIHARENVTVPLAVLHAKMLLSSKEKGVCYVLIPMANPDGTELALFGTSTTGKYKEWLETNFKDCDFSLWKANVRGVDLNNNFNAKFNTNTNSFAPSAHGFPGTHPESEPETQVLVNFTKCICPKFTISFHCKGEEVYFDFFQSHRNRIRDLKIAKLFAQDFGYKVKSTQEISSGGFKDWCVSVLGIPSLTIELASDKLSHPIKSEHAIYLQKQTQNLHKLCKQTLKIIEQYSQDAT